MSDMEDDEQFDVDHLVYLRERIAKLEKAITGARKLLHHFQWAKPEDREFCIHGAYGILDDVLDKKIVD